MVIDFHTHAFNEKIAEAAISKLENIIGYKAFTNGTINDSIEKFDKWGIDKAVMLPIATKPSQQKIINDWAANIPSGRIIPFGSVHPFAPDAISELERIKALGLKGIKLHPDYQAFYIDDDRVFPIYKKCAELNLIVVFHSGIDIVSPENTHATPEMSARAFKAVPQMKMVLAHLGGNDMWDDVEKYLVGLDGDIYFDTAFIADICSVSQLLRIIRNHGADRILFASDCPWHKSISELEMIKRLDLSDKEREMILHENAERLLNL